MPEKFEIFYSVDAEGNSAVSLETAEAAHEACAEYDAGPVRTVCLSVAMALPEDGADEDAVTVVDVVVPPEDPEDGDGEEAPAEVPAEDEPEAPPELPAEVPAPAEQPAPAEVAA
jgi:hypothetical protein